MPEQYAIRDVDGLRLMKGSLPVAKAGDILVDWAKQGYTDACKDLAGIYKCSYVTGSKAAINNARLKHGLPPKQFPKDV